MVDMMAIQGAMTSLKTMSDIVKGLSQLKSTADIQGKVIELQEVILAAQRSAFDAQSQYSTMVERIRELEEEIADMKTWDKQKQNYKLIYPLEDCGFSVYALKESCKGAEAPHWMCTKCY